jgi:hypothetical protein
MSMAGRKNCITCNKGGIIMLCDRCDQTFCDKHVIEHRQQSTNQLDGIMIEHDFIQDEIRQSSNNHSLMKSIDKWEKDSIVKIQTAAENARTELREMMETSKERLSIACQDIIEKLKSARSIGEYCENDLNKSMQQLKQFKMKIASPLTVNLIEDKKSVINLITLHGVDFMNEDFEKDKIYSITKRVQTSDNQEKFARVIGPATINEGGLLIKHNGPHSTLAYILGEELYSHGRQTIRFKIEKSQIPYNIFFGCISSQGISNKIQYNSSLVAGWFGHDEVYNHGTCNKNAAMHGYDTNRIGTYDIVSLTFDCDEKLIELYPERTKKIHELSIDLDKTPFPWQLLVILTYGNDCVRILYNG